MTFCYHHSITQADDCLFFRDDLRYLFPELAHNHEISTLLKARGVITFNADPEVSSVGVYFSTVVDAQDFIERLNAQPEVANYVEPSTDELSFGNLRQSDWNRVKPFLQKTLTASEYQQLRRLINVGR